MSKYKLIIGIIIFVIGGYFLSTNIIGHSTTKLVSGKKLVVTDVCKPLENKCEILGEDLKLNIQFKAAASYQRLLPITLNSTLNPLDEAFMSLVIGEKEMPQEAMINVRDNKHWVVQLMPFAEVTKENLKIRLTVLSKGERYFSEVLISY